MRVLVTGGAGYIGSITTRALLDAGHECAVLDSLIRGHRWAVDARADFFEGSVGDRDVVDLALRGCDAVMHLAGLIEVAESQAEPELYHDFNVRQPCVMLEAMLEHRVHNIVFSSTAAVYGEPQHVPVTEDAATLPVNVYGNTKLQFEQKLDEYSEKGLSSIRFRYFNVAGATPDATSGEAHEPETHLIPRILQAVIAGERTFSIFGDDYPTSDGTCVRDYIHVMDLAAAHIIGLERLNSGGGGGVFNLGNGRGFTNLQVVEECASVTGTELGISYAPRREGDPAVLVASSVRAREELGWTPQRSELHTMVSDAWRWHLARSGHAR